LRVNLLWDECESVEPDSSGLAGFSLRIDSQAGHGRNRVDGSPGLISGYKKTGFKTKKNQRGGSGWLWPGVLIGPDPPLRNQRGVSIQTLRDCLRTRQKGRSRANLGDDKISRSLPDRS